MSKINVRHMDTGNGWIGYYITTTVDKIYKYIAKRGLYRIVVKRENEKEYQELTLEEFKIIYKRSY